MANEAASRPARPRPSRAIAIVGEPEPSLCAAAEESTADSDEAFSGANPLQRLLVALRVAGAAASVELAADVLFFAAVLFCAVLFFAAAVLFGAELAKTARPLLRVTPSVAPLRRALN